MSRASGNEPMIADALIGLGTIKLNQGHYRDAIQELEECLTLDSVREDMHRQGWVVNKMAIAYEYLGDIQKGVEYYTRALDLFRQVEDKRGEGLILSNLSDTYLTQGLIEQAIDYAEKALEIHNALQNGRLRVYDYLHLANAYAYIGQLERALDYYQQGQQVNREVSERFVECLLMKNLSHLYLQMGDNQQAMGFAQQALNVAHHVDTKYGECYALRVLGQVYTAMKDDASAEDYFMRAVQTADGIQHAFLSHAARIDLASAHLQRGALDKALETILEARRGSFDETNTQAAVMHGVILLRLGRQTEAYIAFHEAMAFADAMLGKTPKLYEARYTYGLALAGLALCHEGERRQQYLNEAIDNYRVARQTCGAAGVLARMMRLLDALDIDRVLLFVRGTFI
jgi:tetratricopeptide (TPR) repeat protein